MVDRSEYAIREIEPRKRFRIVKFTHDGDPVSWNDMTIVGNRLMCTCQRSTERNCRHRWMLFKFNEVCAIDSGRRYRYETGEWLPALFKVEM